MKKEEMKKVMNEVVVFTKEQKEEYKSSCRQIVNSMKSLETSFIKLALALHNVDSGKLYEIEGYKNVYEFAKERYNISKSTCYNYLGLVDAFGLTADSKPLYTYTQMVALLPAVRAGVDIEAKISPNMSVSEIKKSLKVLVPDRVNPAPKSDSQRRKKEVLFNFPSMEDFDAFRNAIEGAIREAIENGREVCIVAQ